MIMPRALRTWVPDQVYHVLNRANARATIFESEEDYAMFETILMEAKKKFPMRILAYCIMPNHWHLVLYPGVHQNLPAFMHWLTLTHTQRYHVVNGTGGLGHIYQGRYKSFFVQTNEYFLQLCRYVERNPVRAGLVKRAEQWRWSSAWRRVHGLKQDQILLDSWPVVAGTNYLEWLNEPSMHEDEQLVRIRKAVAKGNPLGNGDWVERAAKQFGLSMTLRDRGRPKKHGI